MSRIYCQEPDLETTRGHAGGFPCYEGTYRVPEIDGGFTACCSEFSQHIDTCISDIRYEYWQYSDTWVICIDPIAGGGGITIEFCPHCGTSLKGKT